MAIALATGQKANAQGNSVDPLACVFPGNVTSGNPLIACVGFNTTGDTAVIASVTSTRTTGNWSCAVHLAGNGLTETIYWAIATSTGACTVTVDFTAGQDYQDVRISEYTGFTATPVLDQIKSGTGNSAYPQTGDSPTTTAANELVIASCMTVWAISGLNTGYTLLDQTGYGDVHTYKVVASTGVQSADGVQTSGQWCIVLATFKAGATGALTFTPSADPMANLADAAPGLWRGLLPRFTDDLNA